MNVSEVMTREFEALHADATLLDAIRHLSECPLVEDEIGIKCVVVTDVEDRLIGILTQSDVVGEILFPYFVRDLANRSDEQRAQMATRSISKNDFLKLAAWAAKVKVRDVMSRNPETIRPDSDLFEAADTIVSRRIKSLPVMEGDRVVGIVYRSSLFKHIAEAILSGAASGVP